MQNAKWGSEPGAVAGGSGGERRLNDSQDRFTPPNPGQERLAGWTSWERQVGWSDLYGGMGGVGSSGNKGRARAL